MVALSKCLCSSLISTIWAFVLPSDSLSPVGNHSTKCKRRSQYSCLICLILITAKWWSSQSQHLKSQSASQHTIIVYHYRLKINGATLFFSSDSHEMGFLSKMHEIWKTLLPYFALLGAISYLVLCLLAHFACFNAFEIKFFASKTTTATIIFHWLLKVKRKQRQNSTTQSMASLAVVAIYEKNNIYSKRSSPIRSANELIFAVRKWVIEFPCPQIQMEIESTGIQFKLLTLHLCALCVPWHSISFSCECVP